MNRQRTILLAASTALFCAISQASVACDWKAARQVIGEKTPMTLAKWGTVCNPKDGKRQTVFSKRPDPNSTGKEQWVFHELPRGNDTDLLNDNPNDDTRDRMGVIFSVDTHGRQKPVVIWPEKYVGMTEEQVFADLYGAVP